MVGNFPEYVSAGARLPAVDTDPTLSPASSDTRRAHVVSGRERCRGQGAGNVSLVALSLERLLGRVGDCHEVGKGGRAVVVTEIQEDVRDRRSERVGQGLPKLVGL